MLDKKILREVIYDQKEEVSILKGFVEREAYKSLKNFTEIPHVVVVSGIRRCGKTTLLKQFLINEYGDDFYYITFEDERLARFELDDFNNLYSVFLELFGEKKVFFLDEIQNVNGWEKFIRRLYEKGIKFYITGSNSSLLGKEFATSLTGRYVLLALYPFSFREFLGIKGIEFKSEWIHITEKKALIKRELGQYIISGGFPEYLKFGNKEILRRIHEAIIYKDIIARYEIKEHLTLREMSIYILTNIGNYFSYNGLKKIFGLGSPNTAKKFIGYLEDSYLIQLISPLEFSLKKQIIAPKKAYASDTGLRETLGFKFSRDLGRLMENVVYLQLRREENEVYYFKEVKECDFIVRDGGRVKAAIQVSVEMEDIKTKKREIGGLIEAMRKFNLNEGLIITEDMDEEEKVENFKIVYKPLWKWLLGF